MSDKEVDWSASVAIELKDRIEALEKKQKEGWENIKKLFYSLLEDTKKSLKEQIVELRESVEAWIK